MTQTTTYHVATVNGRKVFYRKAGDRSRPTIILLHGFPGNEKKLDLAQALRRAGYDVLYFDPRGSWGSPGAYSISNSIEDTDAAIGYLRDPANAKRLRSDPARIILIGHSMGGLAAANAGARDPAIKAVALISAANMSDRGLAAIKDGHADYVVGPLAKSLAENGMAPLAGCTPESVARDWIANAAKWNLPDEAAALATRPTLIVTSDDGLAPANDALTANLRARHAPVTAAHFATDHSYSDQRIALETAVLNWLAGLTL